MHSLQNAKGKVAWDDLCYPKEEGGLGLKRLKPWNRAATLKHIWNLHRRRHTIWVNWAHTHLLKGRSLWHIDIPSNPTWAWRKILQSREWCRGDFTVQIGDGNHTSLWHDYWLPDGKRISDLLAPRVLMATGYSWHATVSEIINNGQWMFPQGDSRLHNIWNTIPPPSCKYGWRQGRLEASC